MVIPTDQICPECFRHFIGSDALGDVCPDCEKREEEKTIESKLKENRYNISAEIWNEAEYLQKRYIDLFKHFQAWSPEIIEKMKMCSHHFDKHSLNPFHLEDDVWTHTVLMYREFLNSLSAPTGLFGITKKQLNRFDSIAISILCHDIGKIYTRHVPRGNFGKIAMYGHEYASIQPTVDFILYLKRFFSLDIDKNIDYILNMISNHMKMKSIKRDITLLCNNDGDLILDNIKLYNIDNAGSIVDYDADDGNIPDFKYGIQNFMTFFTKTVYIFCGVPGAGKDYVAAKTLKDLKGTCEVYSYDDMRMKLYEENHDTEGMTTQEIYQKAFEFCKKINIHKLMFDEIKEDNPDNIFICNVNVTQKARKKIIDSLPEGCRIVVYYVVAEKETIYQRDSTRNSKNLGKLVVNKFMYNQQIPTMDEGIHEIKFIVNE